VSDKEITKHFVVKSVYGALEEPRQWLLSQLRQYDYSENDIFAIHLALEEAFYNAIKHGNELNSDEKVRMDYVIQPEQVRILMTDEGPGFNPENVPDCRVGENLYKTEGRGILLMKSYMDEVRYNETGNSVEMIRYRHPDESLAPKEKVPKR
jgi:serine/threonine-protein kinase RsbW